MDKKQVEEEDEILKAHFDWPRLICTIIWIPLAMWIPIGPYPWPPLGPLPKIILWDLLCRRRKPWEAIKEHYQFFVLWALIWLTRVYDDDQEDQTTLLRGALLVFTLLQGIYKGSFYHRKHHADRMFKMISYPDRKLLDKAASKYLISR